MPTISQRIGLALACGTQATPVGFGLLVPGGRGKPGTEETSRTDGAGTLHLLVTVSVAIDRPAAAGAQDCRCFQFLAPPPVQDAANRPTVH